MEPPVAAGSDVLGINRTGCSSLADHQEEAPFEKTGRSSSYHSSLSLKVKYFWLPF